MVGRTVRSAPPALVIAALVTASLAVLGPVGAIGAVGGQPTATGFGQADDPTPTNDTTRHEDPRVVQANGDLGALRAWLGGRMTVRLEDCVVRVGLGETNVCEFREDYPAWAERYVDVAEDTAGDDDDRRARTFNRTRRTHRSYGEAVASFRETYREYQRAREAGADARARRLARELRRQANAVHESGDEILAQYGVIEAEAGVELATARTSVNTTVENVSETADAVETAEFVNTTLEIDLDPRRISFSAPGTASGRLATADGEPVANRAIRLRFPDRSVRTRTDGSGRFAVEYRPVTVPSSTEELTVRFVPRSESIYLASTATTPVAITPVDPTVSVAVGPATAGFGEAVRVSGTVGVDAVAVAGVPVVVTIGDRRVGRARTGDDGRFSVATAVRATDRPGEAEVRAVLPLEDRAVAGAAGTATVVVRETATTLTVDATAAGPTRAAVEGVLETADGTPVPNQPVTLRTNGTAVATVRTGEAGRFDATVTVPSSLRAEETATAVRLSAAFDGTATNLRPSRSTVAVTLPAANPSEPGDPNPLREALRSLTLFEGLIVAAVVVLPPVLYLGRRWGPWSSASRDEPESGPGDGGPSGAADAGETGPAGSPLDRARERLATDADGAVMLAYATVRDALAETGRAGRRADTHWEFLAACRADGLTDAEIAGLTALTEAYESAAYAPALVSTAAAESAVRTAEGLL